MGSIVSPNRTKPIGSVIQPAVTSSAATSGGAANDEILKMLEQAVEHYRPGGEFAGIRGEQLAEKKSTIIPGMRSELVGRGLTGTTIGGAIPAAFEQQVAKPWQTETEMLRSGRLMEAILAKSGIMERTGARDQQAELQREKMRLDEMLANRQITAQEHQAALDRAQQMALGKMQQKSLGGGGGGGGGGGSTGFMEGYGNYQDGVYVGGLGAKSGTAGGAPQPHSGGYPSPYGGGGGGDDAPVEWAKGVTIGGKQYPAGYQF